MDTLTNHRSSSYSVVLSTRTMTVWADTGIEGGNILRRNCNANGNVRDKLGKRNKNKCLMNCRCHTRHQERVVKEQALSRHYPSAAVLLLALWILLSATMALERVTFAHAFVLRQTTWQQRPAVCRSTSKSIGHRYLQQHPLFTSQNRAVLDFTPRNNNAPIRLGDTDVTRLAAVAAPTESGTCSCTEAPQHHAHGRVRQTVTSLSILCWIISMLSHAAPLFGNRRILSKLRFVALPSVALAIPTVASKARRAVFVKHRVDSSCMMLAASLGALALGEYTEAAAVTSLFAVSHVLEDRAADRSASALSAVARDLGPGRTRLIISDSVGVSGKGASFGVDHDHEVSEQIIDVPADQVSVGSSVSVPVGDKIPCDGVVLSGNTFVDVSSVTGESRPLRRTTSDAVPAGGVNAGPERIVVRTTAMASDSAVARLAKLVEDSLARKSPTEVMVDELAGQYAPVIFSLALFMATVPWIFFGCDIGRVWTRRGLITMVAACPCPLVISTPVSYIAALAVTAQEGIIVKGGAILEVCVHECALSCLHSGLLTSLRLLSLARRHLVGWTKLRLIKQVP